VSRPALCDHFGTERWSETVPRPLLFDNFGTLLGPDGSWRLLGPLLGGFDRWSETVSRPLLFNSFGTLLGPDGSWRLLGCKPDGSLLCSICTII